MKIVGIYGLQNKLKPDKWYVGQSLDVYDRWKNAYEKVKCKKQPKIYHALIKYGYDGFNKVLLEECRSDKLILLNRENYWIVEKNSIENGYNLIEARPSERRPIEVKEKISNTLKGHVVSEETHKKISMSNTGKQYPNRKRLSLESKNKLSLSRTGNKSWNFGKPMSKETKNKIGQSQMGEKNHQYGKKHTEETRAKMRASHQRRNQQVLL